MRLALVIEKYDPQGGGAERSTQQIAMELVSRGHDVTVICAQCEMTCDGKIKIHRLPNSGKLHAARLKRFSAWAKAQLQQDDFDVSLSMTTTVPATILQPRSGTAKETLLRNLAVHAPSERLVKQIFNAISPKKRALLQLEQQTLADPMIKRIAANSQYVKTQLALHYQVPSEKVVVIPNAATLPTFTAQQRANWRTQIRRGYQIPVGQDDVVFVFAAMNPMLKGLVPLMQAFARLVAADKLATLLLAGKYKKSHLDLAVNLGIRKHVRFVGQTNQMVELYAASDVLVHPTFYDPSSKVVIEALMMGIPAISTRFNGASDFIIDEKAGMRGRVIGDPADDNALADAMIELLDADARQTCRDAMGGLVESLSMSRHVDQLEKLLHHYHLSGTPGSEAPGF